MNHSNEKELLEKLVAGQRKMNLNIAFWGFLICANLWLIKWDL
ncbi:MAG: hypothetical protein HLUCCO02_09040 [Idiomarinaceae bacterium HL-53]|nr:MAG: hypothetical protein HLUCCO02_09040 [Idiomarinaceae bacterium HL-53]